MLRNLHVKNLALIDEAEVNFGDGLNILSGETGAGKSILIGSISLALGEKAGRGMLRENADYGLVELVFSVSDREQEQRLAQIDIFPEDGEVILSRKISLTGRSVCRINAETVPVSRMRQAASLLIDIHGQHEHESLLSKKNHMKYLDAYAQKELSGKLKNLSACYQNYTDCRKALEEASLDEEQQKRELSFLQYEIAEIENAALIPGEDEDLETEYRRLANGRRIMDAAAVCREMCADGSQNASDAVSRGLRELLSVADFDENLGSLSGQLQEIDSLLNDFNRDLAAYLSEMDVSDETLQQVQERLDVINRLKSKYGKTIPAVLEEKTKKEEQAEKLLHYDAYRSELEEQLKKAEKNLQDLSEEVSGIRKKYAAVLTEETKKALRDLNFADVRLEMEFSRLDHYTANGWDEARFLISTNPGEPLKPLDFVASGGELSRIMLALKTVLAENDEIETLIFDEIDSGISGRTAQMVAEKIKLTGKSHQIICITHLPQIAAMADHHFLIEKISSGSATISGIRRLERTESIAELARMLGGVKITDAVMQTAREMKEMAEAVR